MCIDEFLKCIALHVIFLVFQLETLDDPVTPAEAILKRCSKQQVCFK